MYKVFVIDTGYNSYEDEKQILKKKGFYLEIYTGDPYNQKEKIACDPYINPEKFKKLGAKPVDLNALLERSHVISLHCNLTEETHHLLSQKAFSKMKQKPIIINTARGRYGMRKP